MPTELGRLDQMTQGFRFYSNQFCGSDVPTQVQALSSGVTSNWQVTTGNSFGTMCPPSAQPSPVPTTPAPSTSKLPSPVPTPQPVSDVSRFPVLDDTSTTSVDYNQQGITGTLPTEVSA